MVLVAGGVEVIRIQEGEAALVKARVTTDAGVALSRDGAASTALASAVSIDIYDLTAGGVLVTSVAPAVADSFTFGATPWLTTGWRKGGVGYNFGANVEDGDVTGGWKGGHTYKLEIKVSYTASPALGGGSESPQVFPVLVEVLTGGT